MLSALLVALAPAPLPPGALSEDAFTELLETGTRQELVEGCERVISLGLDQRLRQLRQTLLTLNTETSSLAVVFADTRALLRCKAPDAALQVLERISPNVGPERQEWLLLQWRAASDGLDQRRAALALERLSEGSAEVLDAQLLTLVEPQEPGELPIQRSALDVQADQLEAMGQERAAIELLLQEGQTAQLTAQRRQRAATLLAAEGEPEQAAEIAGAAVDAAASASAWGLSGALLDDQRRYQLAAADLQGAEQTNARRLRLSRRLADGMGERAAVLSAIADQTSDPALAQQLLDRRDPLERRRGALLDVLLSLDAPAQEGPEERLARLDLAVQVAQRLGHKERLMDLLVLQEREARVHGKAWMRDRITSLAVQQSGGNPSRQLQALYLRQRELLEDPLFPKDFVSRWYPQAQQERLEALQAEEEFLADLDRRMGFDPFPVAYRLPQLFEDLARLQQADQIAIYALPRIQAPKQSWEFECLDCAYGFVVGSSEVAFPWGLVGNSVVYQSGSAVDSYSELIASGLVWDLKLPPALFGKLPRRLSAKAIEQASGELGVDLGDEVLNVDLAFERLKEARDSMQLDVALIEQGDHLFERHVRKLKRREELASFLSEDLAAGELNPLAVTRHGEWLQLEQQLEPRSAEMRNLRKFGRSEKGVQILDDVFQQEDQLRSYRRQVELDGLKTQALQLKEKLEPELNPKFQPKAIATPQEQEFIVLSSYWNEFLSGPSDQSAAQLQAQAAKLKQDPVELEALRYRLALQLASGSADPELFARLRVLEQRLRSPQSRGGHLGPPSPSR